MAMLVLCILAWFALHPYAGLVHDSRIYLLQMFAVQDPARWSDDLFLAYGSQTNLSVFPYLAAAWTQTGLSWFSLWILGQLLWLSACLLLLLRLRRDWVVLGAVVILATHDAYYDPTGTTIAYAERFLTGRVLCEAMALMGLACWVWRRYLLAGECLLLAVLIHPLLGIWALGLVAAAWLPCKVRYSMAVIFLALVAVLVWGRVLPVMDMHWRQLVSQRMPWVFFSWQAWLAQLPWLFLALWLALRLGTQPNLARLLRCLPLMLIAGAILDVLASGGGWDTSAVLVQAQPWRVNWLSHVLVLALVLPAIAQAWRQVAGKAEVLLVFAALLFLAEAQAGSRAAILSATLFSGLALSSLHWSSWRALLVAHPWERHLGWLCGLLGALVFWQLWFKVGVVDQISLMGAEHGLGEQWRLFILAGVVGLGGGLLKYYRPSKLYILCLSLILMSALVMCGLMWDSRSPSQKTLEAQIGQSAATQLILRPGSAVYWPGADPILVWLYLQRPNYLSEIQLAGSAFSRQTALVGAQREQAVSHGEGKQWCKDARLGGVIYSNSAPNGLVVQPFKIGTLQYYWWPCSN